MSQPAGSSGFCFSRPSREATMACTSACVIALVPGAEDGLIAAGFPKYRYVNVAATGSTMASAIALRLLPALITEPAFDDVASSRARRCKSALASAKSLAEIVPWAWSRSSSAHWSRSTAVFTPPRSTGFVCLGPRQSIAQSHRVALPISKAAMMRKIRFIVNQGYCWARSTELRLVCVLRCLASCPGPGLYLSRH